MSEAERIEELKAKLEEQVEWVKSLTDDLIAAEVGKRRNLPCRRSWLSL